MNEEEILKLMNLMIGDTAPHGDHGFDMDRIVPNIDLLGRVTVELVSQLESLARAFEGRTESSIKACGKKARYWADFIETEILEVSE